MSEKTLYEMGVYDLIEHPNDPKAWAVELLNPKKAKCPKSWKGIKYAYGHVGFDTESGENPIIKFELKIIDIPDYLKEREFTQKDQELFHELAYCIIVEELRKFYEEQEAAGKLKEQGLEPIKAEFDINE